MQEISTKTEQQPLALVKDTDIDKQITTAKMYPRSLKAVYDKCVYLATLDKETAEGCVYALPRGKDDTGSAKFVKGPSIRLAEICASSWGNFRVKSGIKENDGKRITAVAVAWDLESNYANEQETQRGIVGKYGKFNEDMQTVTGNAARAIAERNAIFKVIPLAFVNSIMTQANKFAIGLTGETLVVRLDKMIAYFAKLKLSQDIVLKLVQKPTVADMSEDDLITLRGIANGLKDGELKIDELLDSIREEGDKPSSETKPLSKSEEMAARIKAKQSEQGDHEAHFKQQLAAEQAAAEEPL